MLPLRWLLVVTLWLLPPVVLVLVGAYSLIESGRYAYWWWLFPVSWVLAWVCYSFWPTKQRRVSDEPLSVPSHWTERDKAAAELVAQLQVLPNGLTTAALTKPEPYQRGAIQVAEVISRHYAPGSSDPVAALSILEVLTAAELVAEDMHDWIRDHIPGSHLISIGQWRMMGQAAGYWQFANDATRFVSVLWDPTAIGRVLVSKFGLDSITGAAKGELLASFYALFIRQTGFYLIELHSGRLRGGAKAYREFRARLNSPLGAKTVQSAASPSAPEVPVSITVIGQSKAGKSSLVNVLLAETAAKVGVLPTTRNVARYRYSKRDVPIAVDLLDTPGYGETKITPAEMRELEEAAANADIVLFVLEARNAARASDVAVLTGLDAFFANHPERKRPAIIGILSKIDLLSPALDWSPPYNWREGVLPKELSIRQAIDYQKDLFGSALTQVAAVACDTGRARVTGIREELWPLILESLDEGRATALLKWLHADYDQQRLSQTLNQLKNLGRGLVEAYWKGKTKLDG